MSYAELKFDKDVVSTTIQTWSTPLPFFLIKYLSSFLVIKLACSGKSSVFTITLTCPIPDPGL